MDTILTLAEPAWAWLPITLSVTVLLLAVPMIGEKSRKTVALVLTGVSLAAVAAGVAQGTDERSLEVINPMPTVEGGAPERMILEVTSQQSWMWGLTAALLVGFAALVVFLSRRRNPKNSIIVHPVAVSAWLLIARLLFEKAAAPEGLVWATGVSMMIVPITFFIGVAAGRASQSYGRLLVNLLAVAVIQRLMVTGLSWLATAQVWGTHLDMNPVMSVYSPVSGMMTFQQGEGMDAWFHVVAVPQMMLWTPATVVIGAVCGGVGWMISHKKQK